MRDHVKNSPEVFPKLAVLPPEDEEEKEEVTRGVPTSYWSIVTTPATTSPP